MAHVIRDTFDMYAAPTDMSSNMWTNVLSGNTLTATTTLTRWSAGQALRLSGSASANTKYFQSPTYTSSADNWIAFDRYYNAASLPAAVVDAITWYDSGTVQCTVVFAANGDIVVHQGNVTGTTLATFSSAWGVLAWDHWEIKLTVNDTTGALLIRKNGDSSNTYSVTNVDTKATSNASANSVAFVSATTNGGTNTYLDNIWVWNGQSGTPQDWVGDYHPYQVRPKADTAQKDFTATPSTVTVGNTLTPGTISVTANTMWFTQAAAPIPGGVASSVDVNVNTTHTGHCIFFLYDSDGTGGAPGTLLAQTSAQTNITSGTHNLALGTSPNLISGRTYYIGVLADATLSMKSNTNNPSCYTGGSTYSATAPDPAPGSLSAASRNPITISMTLASSNAGSVSEPINTTTSSVAASTVNNLDLYTTDASTAIPGSPTILGVSLRATVQMDDAGPRSAALRVKSSSSTSDSSSLALSTTVQWMNMVQDVDPATSAAWSASAVKAASFGPKVAA